MRLQFAGSPAFLGHAAARLDSGLLISWNEDEKDGSLAVAAQKRSVPILSRDRKETGSFIVPERPNLWGRHQEF
jgi:hypothetical protein